MNKILKVVWCAVFLTLIALPVPYLLGARPSVCERPTGPLTPLKDRWRVVQGWERKAELPKFTFAGFRNRSYQDAFTEAYSKNFFLRAAFLRTAYQLRECSNFGLFHYGYGGSIVEGRDGVVFERPYLDFHLSCPRPGGREKYAEAMKLVGEVNAFCRTNGIFFAFLTMPDKPQCHPECLPRWLGWFFGYSNYDTQGELAQLFREDGIPVFDANRYFRERRDAWEACVYPPGGTHLNAYGSGLLYQGFVETFVDTGAVALRANRFLGVRPRKGTWRQDDDISNLMNLWWNPHVAANVHYDPVYERTNVVLNAGSVCAFGDCYSNTVKEMFADAGLFAPSKIAVPPRGTRQDPKTFAHVAGDLRMVLLCFQSFNSGHLDEHREEIAAIFTALKTAVVAAKGQEKGTVERKPKHCEPAHCEPARCEPAERKPAVPDTATLSVAFPRAGQVLPSVSRTYAIGAVSPDVTNLVVAGQRVVPYRTGAWSALVPVAEGENRLVLVASGADGAVTNEVAFSVTPRVKKYAKLAYAKDAPKGRSAAKTPAETLVFIDPGHGGSDTGAVSPHGRFEKDANLSLAKSVGTILRLRGYRVRLTREDDRAIELYERAREAHREGADAFVSIHHNAPAADASPLTRYSSVYAWNDLGDPLARAIAGKLAETQEDGFPSKGALRANFAVTRSPEIPSCLVEADFITAPAGEEAVFDAETEALRAKAIADGIEQGLRQPH